MAESRRPEALIAHMIRDVFGHPDTTVCYGESKSLSEELSKPTHGMEMWRLYTNAEALIPGAVHWEIALNDAYFGKDYCDLFISVNYNPVINFGTAVDVAIQISRLVVHNGLVCLINPGSWAENLGDFMIYRKDLVDELKSYYLLHNQIVKVYQNGRV